MFTFKNMFLKNPTCIFKSNTLTKNIKKNTYLLYVWQYTLLKLFCHGFKVPPLFPSQPPSDEAMLLRSPHGRPTSPTTTTTTLLRQPLSVLAVAVLLCHVTCRGESQTQSPAQVLQDLLARYGDNSTITVPQLRSLLSLLSQGQGDDNSEHNEVTEMTTTMSPKSNRSKVGT